VSSEAVVAVTGEGKALLPGDVVWLPQPASGGATRHTVVRVFVDPYSGHVRFWDGQCAHYPAASFESRTRALAEARAMIERRLSRLEEERVEAAQALSETVAQVLEASGAYPMPEPDGVKEGPA
jgi:hypothetical protein